MIDRRFPSLAAAMLLSACTAGGPPALPVVGFDGIYTGTETGEAGGPGCAATQRAIVLHVLQGRIWVHSHRINRQIAGTVLADGQVSMIDESTHRQITGEIIAHRLTAEETTVLGGKSAPFTDNIQPIQCQSRIIATHPMD